MGGSSEVKGKARHSEWTEIPVELILGLNLRSEALTVLKP